MSSNNADTKSVHTLHGDPDAELTALHLAAGAGQLPVVRLLLEQGADPRARRVNDFTPLHAAAMHGHADVVDLLIGAGAPNVQTTPQRYAPPHSAAWAGHAKVVAALLAGGALPMLRNHRNLTAAEVARKNGHALVAEVIEADLRLARPNLLLTTLTWGHMTDQTSREFKDARLYPGGAAAWDWGKTGTRHQPGIQWADLEDLMSPHAG